VISPSTLFASLPTTLRKELLDCHREIIRNYAERRWEPAELNGGKLCEVVYTVLGGSVSGTFAVSASKPPSMVDACRSIESRPANPTRVGDRSLRILIPRLLPFLYEIRNNRGVGHVGGEVDPNHEDAEAVVCMANWVMAELIRIFHSVSLAEAQAVVDSLVEKRHPLVWEFEGVKRVLNPKMSKSDQTLVLLYSARGWAEVKTLCGWVEYSSLALFKSRILSPLHKARMAEYDAANGRAQVTPLGIQFAEKELLPSQ
jgi:hypothetical protein